MHRIAPNDPIGIHDRPASAPDIFDVRELHLEGDRSRLSLDQLSRGFESGCARHQRREMRVVERTHTAGVLVARFRAAIVARCH
jgi:hypothetical protein